MEQPPAGQEAAGTPEATAPAEHDAAAQSPPPVAPIAEPAAAVPATAAQGSSAAVDSAQTEPARNGAVASAVEQEPAAASTSAPPVPAAPAVAALPAEAPAPAAAPSPPAHGARGSLLSGSKRPYEEAAGAYPAAAGPPAGTAGPPAAFYPAHPGYYSDGGEAKRQQLAPLGPADVPRETVYRLVLDTVDTALIIGRGGNTVRQIEAATGGRVKRLQEPPGAREQVVVIWNSARELPSPGRVTRNAAQEALIDCVRRVVFQESAPMGQAMGVRLLINRTQEQGVMDNMGSIVSENPGISIELKRGDDLPACALDNDVLVELNGERYSLMSAVEAVSHVLREHPILERPGGAPPALRGQGPAGPPAIAAGGYGAGGYGGYGGY